MAGLIGTLFLVFALIFFLVGVNISYDPDSDNRAASVFPFIGAGIMLIASLFSFAVHLS